MAEIKDANGNQVIDYMARDYDSFLKAMRDLIPDKLPEWVDHESEADFGNVLLQLFAHIGDILSYYQDRIANESFLGTARTRRSIIHHLRLIGYRLSTAAPASAALTLTATVNSPQTIVINKGDAFATKSQKDKPSVRFEYTRGEPLTIDLDPGKTQYGPIPVEEGRLIEEEILGISDGSPGQRFSLAHPKLILRSLGAGQEIFKDIILTTELGNVIEEWTLQESLAFSFADQMDFVLEINENDQCMIFFGDGTFGAIPAAGATIKATYRVGGGVAGNVAPNSIETIVDAPQLALLGAEVTNPEAATGGAERESIERAVQHAPEVFRSHKRAVTANDYKALALDFQGVGKVRAESTNWNTVILYVAPEGGGQVSDVLRASLLAYFEDKRHLSTFVEIEDVDYVNIYVTAEIGIEAHYPEDEIVEKVKAAGAKLLAFHNVDFGKPIYLSKFYEVIEAINGVAFVNISEFRRQGQAAGLVDPEGRIVIKVNEIPKIPGDVNYAPGIQVILERGS